MVVKRHQHVHVKATTEMLVRADRVGLVAACGAWRPARFVGPDRLDVVTCHQCRCVVVMMRKRPVVTEPCPLCKGRKRVYDCAECKGMGLVASWGSRF